MGAAMCAGIGVGLFTSYQEAVERMVRVSRTVSLCAEDGRSMTGNTPLQALRRGDAKCRRLRSEKPWMIFNRS